MRRLPLLVLIACGSAPPAQEPAPAPPPPTEAEGERSTSDGAAGPSEAPAADMERETVNVYARGELGEARSPEPGAEGEAGVPAVQTKPAIPVHDRLRDQGGPVLGLAGFSTRSVPDARHCGGIRIVTKRSKKVAAADTHLVAVYALEFPTGLDFSPEKKARTKRSLETFNRWVEQLRSVKNAANDHYAGLARSADRTASAIALARLVQIEYRLASVLARGEIPKDVRTGELVQEKTSAFCDTLRGLVEPLVASAESTLERCREVVRQAPVGWWTDVCAAPPK